MKKPFEPNFKTPQDKLSKEEHNKIAANLRGSLRQELLDHSKADISWEAEQVAKSHGMYLEFNRAKTGEEKDWMYMIRISIPGGGPLTREQYNIVDQLTEKYTKDSDGHPSIRLTNRQNIQFHWVKKEGVIDVVKTLAESGMNTLNGCGDNTRNVMGCPFSRFSDIFNANEWAQKTGRYFQLPIDPFIEVFQIDPNKIRRPGESFEYGKNLMNRKFKIGYSTVHKDPKTGAIIKDNCTEVRSNDMGVAPIVENGKVTKFQIYVGGSQGERNGKPSMAALGLPICRVSVDQLMQALDASVKVHMEWGDRENRWWARVKYLIKKKGPEWYREQMQVRLPFKLEDPDVNYDPGPRELHHGWMVQPSNGLLAFGAFIENGRITDFSPNGKLKSMVRHLMNKYPIEFLITPNQDIIFSNIPHESKADFEKDLESFGFGKRNGKAYSTLRLQSGACVGRDTCRLTYTDSEKFEPFLIDELEAMGWGDKCESIGITGCERQCFRPATKTIGLVGSGMDRYQFKLYGDVHSSCQGVPLIGSDNPDVLYLRSVPRENCATVIDALFKFHEANAKPGEDMGAYHRRIGMDAIIKHLKENPVTAPFMAKPFPADHVIE